MTDRKVALVIGAGDYLGGAICRRFAREGFAVCGTRRGNRNAGKGLDELVAAIEKEGGEAHPYYSDARSEDEVIDLVEAVERDVGPIEVFVFNVGGNVKFSILETTTRVYTKVWEMCALAGFLNGREVARRMVERGHGTMIFTGATASMRGADGFAAFAGGKHALKALAQSMARELGPKGVHVAHIVIDGAIDTASTRELFPEWFAERPEDGILQPDDIAENYWQLHRQPRGAWTFEMDLRPYVEKW